MNRRAVFGTIVITALAQFGCNRSPEEAEAVKSVLVEVSAAAEAPMEDVLVSYGTLDYLPARSQAIVVQVESQVAARMVFPGSSVKEGEPLLRLVPSAATRLDLGKASRDVEVAQGEAQRLGRLREQGLATDSDLRSAKAAAQNAVELRNSLVARTGSAGVTVRAPVSGVIDDLSIQPGEVVPAGSVVLRIADPTALYVRLGIEPGDAPRVQSGRPVKLAPLTPGATGFAGHVTELDSRVDAQSHLASAVVLLDSPPQVMPGSLIRGAITTDVHPNAVTVPKSAVLYSNDQPFVFILVAGKAERRNVALGYGDASRIEISQGVKVGELAITGGNYELTDGMHVQRVDSAGPADPLEAAGPDRRPTTSGDSK